MSDTINGICEKCGEDTDIIQGLCVNCFEVRNAKFINRFGEEISMEKQDGLKLKYSLSDIVFSESLGVCMVQDYGKKDETYWLETGIWSKCGWRNDILNRIKGKSRIKFMKKYLDNFNKNMLEKFFPEGDPHREIYKKHAEFIKKLIVNT